MKHVKKDSIFFKSPLGLPTATHSSILAWRIPWTEEPGGLQSRGGVTKELNTADTERAGRDEWSAEGSNIKMSSGFLKNIYLFIFLLC